MFTDVSIKKNMFTDFVVVKIICVNFHISDNYMCTNILGNSFSKGYF